MTENPLKPVREVPFFPPTSTIINLRILKRFLQKRKFIYATCIRAQRYATSKNLCFDRFQSKRQNVFKTARLRERARAANSFHK